MTKALSMLAKLLAKLARLLFHRIGIIAVMILLQIGFYIVVFAILSSSPYYRLFSWALNLLSALVALWIAGNRSNPGYKVGWIIIVLMFPPLGAVAYLLLGETGCPSITSGGSRQWSERSDRIWGETVADQTYSLSSRDRMPGVSPTIWRSR